jgi:hypothetical protein
MSTPANEAKPPAEGTSESRPATPSRKPYSAPVLEPLGDIRDVTLAGSIGAGESGMFSMTRKP